jgi:transcription initiation factor TFIIB
MRKTQKNKLKKKKWKEFDKMINDNKQKVECVYEKKNSIDNCSLCNGLLILSEDYLLSCTNPKCGIIYTNKLDNSPEWRYYGNDDNSNIDPTRCGMPINPLLKESSFGCKVICTNKNSYEMRRVRRYTEWQSMPYREKAQYEEFQRIQALATEGGLTKIIIDEAMRQHKLISEQKTFRGVNRDGIIAASIYIACRINNNPRTPKEIASIFKLDNTSATRGCKNAINILNSFECDLEDNCKTKFISMEPSLFIDRYCSCLQINKELTQLCKFIALRVSQQNLIPENTPPSIAAGIIYFVAQICSLLITKQQVFQISKTSEVTINKVYKKLNENIKDLVPAVILNKYK